MWFKRKAFFLLLFLMSATLSILLKFEVIMADIWLYLVALLWGAFLVSCVYEFEILEKIGLKERWNKYEVLEYWDIVKPGDKIRLKFTTGLHPKRILWSNGERDFIPHPDKNHPSNRNE